MPLDKRHSKNQGMNWIRPEKRLAIYLRDGLACSYCGKGLEEEVKLTLDHLKPYSAGGSNEPGNLVTACLSCNSARGNRSWKKFSTHVAAYINHGVTPAAIVAHITETRKRELPLAEAKVMFARRGGFTAALAEASKQSR